MAAARDCELTADRREYGFHLVAQRHQDRNGDHGNEGKNQGVLHESLASLALQTAQRALGANDKFVNNSFHPLSVKNSLKTFTRRIWHTLPQNLPIALLVESLMPYSTKQETSTRKYGLYRRGSPSETRAGMEDINRRWSCSINEHRAKSPEGFA
jgi:hypothetical protein